MFRSFFLKEMYRKKIVYLLFLAIQQILRCARGIRVHARGASSNRE